MDARTLARAMGDRLALADYQRLAPAFNNAMIAANCTNLQRAAMWCAQIGHESAGLYYMEEIASGDAYEWRSDLGNNQPGDGRRFKGSGPIQLTGRANFGKFSQWCFDRKYTNNPTQFVDHPEQVRDDPHWGFLAATWYWVVARPQINSMCDHSDLVGVTQAINGGTNGLDDRRNRFNRCIAIGDALLPTKGDSMSVADDELSKKFPSRSKYRDSDEPIDTLVGFVLNVDARLHEEFVEREALKGVGWCIDLVKREADKGDAGSKAIIDQIVGTKGVKK